ncbi:LOW QUALITY PROTEIN: hypothetical protein JCM19037_4251 [Geomicrobium sp. JCM 19037]|nr:LOW QUALITY PROTEIN: hypothetical protein JCM19037_4251 [Geomicrobium sp. JCM 19037]
MSVTFQDISTNGVCLRVARAGDDNGKLVILLHGFPDFWYGWREQIDPLVAAGFHVLIPNQRGYDQSEKPHGVNAIILTALRDDVIGLIGALGRERAIIIGHDWGGAVGWHLATTRPEFVEKFIPINIPHPVVLPRGMVKNPTQLFRSWYIAFFQMRHLPEKALQTDDYTYMKLALQVSSEQPVFSEQETEAYEQSWQHPGALTGMINWYRAIPLSLQSMASNELVRVPTQIIWGMNDRFLARTLAKESLKQTVGGNGILVSDAGHWVHLEQPEIVNRHIIAFIT